MNAFRWFAAGLAVLCVPAVLAKPLPEDTRIETGKLDNGVTWMYRQHDNPPEKMALLVHVDTGSLNEKESQRGLAHFLEHMCFNGTENFPPGTLIDYFESIGMEFGADLNASTSFETTMYMLFTPDTETETVGKALMTLSDYVFRALLPKEEIDKERNVIMEEWRTRRGAAQRIQDKLFEQVFAGTRFAERLPIGLPEVIKTAGRKEFVDYYRTWYRPERITVMLVGDAPSGPIKPLIEKWFGQYKPKSEARKEHGAEFKPFTDQRAFVFTDPEWAGGQVQLINVQPGRGSATTVEKFRVELIEQLASTILNKRFEQRVQEGDASYRNAGASVFDFFDDALLIFGSAQGEPEDWNKMLEEVIVDVVRAREHGFTSRELELAKSDVQAGAERAVRTEPTRSARSMLFQMAGKISDEEPIMSAQQRLEIINELLPGISETEVSAAFAGHFSNENFAVVVTLPEKEDVSVPSTDEVLAAARAAFARKTEAIDEEAAPDSLLAKLPEPGKLAEFSKDEDLKITSAWLENGARVHHRFMDYKKDSVLVSISFAGGKIQEKKDTIGLTEAAASAISSQPATSRLTSTNIRDLMTGKNIGTRCSAQSDLLSFTISGSPEDLETGMQLAHALITDGRIEESALKNWKLRRKESIKQFRPMPQFRAAEAMIELLSGGDMRLKLLLPEKRIDAITLDQVQKWYRKLCDNAPIEVAVVGEIERDKAMSLVKKYIGSLSQRPREATALDSLRVLARSTGPYKRRVEVETQTDKAMVIAGFLGCEAHDVYDTRALELASKVITSRMIDRIREELALVYSIRARSAPSEVYRDSGRFAAQAPCEPKNADQFVTEAHKIFTEFAGSGPTDEELANAKKQIKNNLDEDMKEPRYWFGVLRDLTFRNRSLEDEKAEATAYEPYKAEDVVKVFNKYYTPVRKFEVVAVPVPPSEADTEKAQAAAASS